MRVEYRGARRDGAMSKGLATPGAKAPARPERVEEGAVTGSREGKSVERSA